VPLVVLPLLPLVELLLLLLAVIVAVASGSLIYCCGRPDFGVIPKAVFTCVWIALFIDTAVLDCANARSFAREATNTPFPSLDNETGSEGSFSVSIDSTLLLAALGSVEVVNVNMCHHDCKVDSERGGFGGMDAPGTWWWCIPSAVIPPPRKPGFVMAMSLWESGENNGWLS
jgi:hypothetical protein